MSLYQHNYAWPILSLNNSHFLFDSVGFSRPFSFTFHGLRQNRYVFELHFARMLVHQLQQETVQSSNIFSVGFLQITLKNISKLILFSGFMVDSGTQPS